MAWDGDYWGPNGALAIAKRAFEASECLPFDMIAYASAKYSAANRVMADVKALHWGGIHRFKQGIDLGMQSVTLVDRAWVSRDRLTDPYDVTLNKRLDALDVSCAVWLRWGWIVGGRKGSAKLHLMPMSWREEEKVLPHTLALLTLHAVKADMIPLSGDLCQEIEELASQTAAASDFGQASRICRYMASCLPRKAPYREQLLQEAEVYAKRGEVSDQLAKLGLPVDRV